MPPRKSTRTSSTPDEKTPSGARAGAKQSKRFVINSHALTRNFYIFMVSQTMLPPLVWCQAPMRRLVDQSDAYADYVLLERMDELYRNEQEYKQKKEREWDVSFTSNSTQPIVSWIPIDKLKQEWDVL